MQHDQFDDYVSGSLFLPEHDCQVVVEKNNCRAFLEAAFKQGYEYSNIRRWQTWAEVNTMQKTMLKSRETTIFYINREDKTIGSGPAARPYFSYKDAENIFLFESVFVPDAEKTIDFEEIQQLIHL